MLTFVAAQYLEQEGQVLALLPLLGGDGALELLSRPAEERGVASEKGGEEVAPRMEAGRGGGVGAHPELHVAGSAEPSMYRGVEHRGRSRR